MKDELFLTLTHASGPIYSVLARPRITIVVNAWLPARAEELAPLLRQRSGREPEWGAIGASADDSRDARGAPLVWRSLAIDEARALAALARLLAGELALDAVMDTAEYYSITRVRGVVDERAIVASASQQASGYRGPGARAFAALVAGLLQFAAAPIDEHTKMQLLNARD